MIVNNQDSPDCEVTMQADISGLVEGVYNTTQVAIWGMYKWELKHNRPLLKTQFITY